jgi:hypothetical protein
MFLFLFLTFASAAAERWVIQLQPAAVTNATQFAAEHGFHYEGPVSFLDPADNFHVFSASGSGRKRSARALRALPEVRAAEEQIPRHYFKRVADPLYEAQWHLHTHPFSINADLAGVRNATGRGVTIAIVDDGLQHTHPDLHANYDAGHRWGASPMSLLARKNV